MTQDQPINKKTIAIAIVSAAAICAVIAASSLWYEESVYALKKAWKVEAVVVKSKVRNDDFLHLTFALLDKDRAILPHPLSYKGEPFSPSYSYKFSHWHYQRRNFTNGQVVLDDAKGYLSGVYDIEVIKSGRPQLIRLYSDSIEIYLLQEYFSLDKPYIDIDFKFER